MADVRLAANVVTMVGFWPAGTICPILWRGVYKLNGERVRALMFPNGKMDIVYERCVTMEPAHG